MADEDGVEIDEFEMFKARSLGVENEYLELARVGKLKRSMKQRPSIASTKQRTSSIHTDSPELQDPKAQVPTETEISTPFKPTFLHTEPTQPRYSDSSQQATNAERLTCGENISSEPMLSCAQNNDINNNINHQKDPAAFLNLNNADTSLQRSVSYRTHRKPSRDSQGEGRFNGTSAENPSISRLNRQRNLTMPARDKRFPRSERRPSRLRRFGNHNTNVNSNYNTKNTDGSYSTYKEGSPDERKGSLAVGYIQENVIKQLSQGGDRSVLRVRNFSTKDGSIINRGDSIKIKKLTKTTPCVSPLSQHQAPNTDANRVSCGNLKLSNDYNSKNPLHNHNNNDDDDQRQLSNSASHLNAKNAQGIADDDAKSAKNNKRLSRQFQSHDEEHKHCFKTCTDDNSSLALGTPTSVSSQRRLISDSKNKALVKGRNCNYNINDYSASGDGEDEGEEDHADNADLQSVDVQACRSAFETNNNVNNASKNCHNNNNSSNNKSRNQDDDVVYKVVVMGMTGVGKSTLIKQMLTSEYLANTENEIDDDSNEKTVSVQIDGEESLLQFLDLDMPSFPQQGWKKKEASQTTPPPAADAHLVVYSVTNKNSYLYAQSCLQDLRPAKRHNAVILVANKQDLVRNRLIQEEEGKSLAHKKHCKFIEVSALLDHKVDDLLVGATRQIRLRKNDGVFVEEDESSMVRGGCLQRAVTDLYNRFIRRRTLTEAISCDDLFTP